MDIANMTVLIRNFILLGYADLFNERKYDMIGTTKDPNVLVIHSFNFEENKYEEVFKASFKKPIYSVTPGNFTGDGKTSLIVTFNQEENFSNKFIQFVIKDKKLKIREIQDLPNSSIPPMAVTDYETIRPAVIIGNSNTITLLRYDTEKSTMIDKILIETEFEICKDHPYSFVDLDGDLKAELVVIVNKEGNQKGMTVYKYEYKHAYKEETGGYREIFEMNLPAGEIGPILFGDFTHKGVNSMIFVNRDVDDSYYLNFYINDLERYPTKHYKQNRSSVEIGSSSSEIFTNTTDRYIRLPLNSIIPDCKPILKIDFSGNELEGGRKIPGGIYATDIDLDGYIEIFLLVKTESSKDTIIPLRLNENNVFDFYNKASDVFKLENVKSFSTIDYNNRGKENIIINRIKDGDMIVEGYFNTLNDINMKLSLTTTNKEKKDAPYGMGLPGASYLIITNHGQQISYTSNFGSGPFLSLNSQTSLIGLGDSTYMIDSLRIGIPAISKEYKGVYVISTNIIQNLDLIISVFKNGAYKIEAFFKIVRYLNKIIFVLAFVGISNVMVWGFLKWNHNKKLKLARTKDSMHPLFRSL